MVLLNVVDHLYFYINFDISGNDNTQMIGIIRLIRMVAHGSCFMHYHYRQIGIA